LNQIVRVNISSQRKGKKGRREILRGTLPKKGV